MEGAEGAAGDARGRHAGSLCHERLQMKNARAELVALEAERRDESLDFVR